MQSVIVHPGEVEEALDTRLHALSTALAVLDTVRARGVEGEARKNLGFLGADFAKYFSIGGNFTWIDATVDRTDAELARKGREHRPIPLRKGDAAAA